MKRFRHWIAAFGALALGVAVLPGGVGAEPAAKPVGPMVESTTPGLPLAINGVAPGPEILHRPPARGPQFENTGVWKAEPTKVCMTSAYRSGEFLYAALWRTGFANRAESRWRDDGLRLDGAWITAPVRCAPPANKPTVAERDRCRPSRCRDQRGEQSFAGNGRHHQRVDDDPDAFRRNESPQGVGRLHQRGPCSGRRKVDRPDDLKRESQIEEVLVREQAAA